MTSVCLSRYRGCWAAVRFIRDLATYEKIPDAVSASEGDLLRRGFGPSGAVRQSSPLPTLKTLLSNDRVIMPLKVGRVRTDCIDKPADAGDGTAGALHSDRAAGGISGGDVTGYARPRAGA